MLTQVGKYLHADIEHCPSGEHHITNCVQIRPGAEQVAEALGLHAQPLAQQRPRSLAPRPRFTASLAEWRCAVGELLNRSRELNEARRADEDRGVRVSLPRDLIDALINSSDVITTRAVASPPRPSPIRYTSSSLPWKFADGV